MIRYHRLIINSLHDFDISTDRVLQDLSGGVWLVCQGRSGGEEREEAGAGDKARHPWSILKYGQSSNFEYC